MSRFGVVERHGGGANAGVLGGWRFTVMMWQQAGGVTGGVTIQGSPYKADEAWWHGGDPTRHLHHHIGTVLACSPGDHRRDDGGSNKPHFRQEFQFDKSVSGQKRKTVVSRSAQGASCDGSDPRSAVLTTRSTAESKEWVHGPLSGPDCDSQFYRVTVSQGVQSQWRRV